MYMLGIKFESYLHICFLQWLLNTVVSQEEYQMPHPKNTVQCSEVTGVIPT